MKDVIYKSFLILFLAGLITELHSCKKEEVPAVTTSEVTNITGTTATGGGTVTEEGSGKVFERGVCWSELYDPTIADDRTTEGGGAGSFTSDLSDLKGSTTYFIKAYATNKAGTGYGDQVKFTTLFVNYSGQTGTIDDIDGNTYPTIGIGSQIWMAENLKTTKFNDGTPIPNVTDNEKWKDLSSPAYCWYNNDIGNKNVYGALYNWHTILKSNNGNRNLCPAGWHVASDSEWTIMEDYLISSGYNFDGTVAGNKLAKSLASTNKWDPSDITGTPGNTDYPSKRNSTGFSAFPSGGRSCFDGSFNYMGYYSCWWTSTLIDAYDAYYRIMYTKYISVYRYNDWNSSGFSIRCLRD
jgi:uncharacterized protein (TIGR02145 family)